MACPSRVQDVSGPHGVEQVGRHQPFEVALVQDDHVIQQVASATPCDAQKFHPAGFQRNVTLHSELLLTAASSACHDIRAKLIRMNPLWRECSSRRKYRCPSRWRSGVLELIRMERVIVADGFVPSSAWRCTIRSFALSRVVSCQF